MYLGTLLETLIVYLAFTWAEPGGGVLQHIMWVSYLGVVVPGPCKWALHCGQCGCCETFFVFYILHFRDQGGRGRRGSFPPNR